MPRMSSGCLGRGVFASLTASQDSRVSIDFAEAPTLFSATGHGARTPSCSPLISSCPGLDCGSSYQYRHFQLGVGRDCWCCAILEAPGALPTSDESEDMPTARTNAFKEIEFRQFLDRACQSQGLWGATLCFECASLINATSRPKEFGNQSRSQWLAKGHLR